MEIAEECGLECVILEKEDCEKMGMGSYLGVSQGECAMSLSRVMYAQGVQEQ